MPCGMTIWLTDNASYMGNAACCPHAGRPPRAAASAPAGETLPDEATPPTVAVLQPRAGEGAGAATGTAPPSAPAGRKRAAAKRGGKQAAEEEEEDDVERGDGAAAAPTSGDAAGPSGSGGAARAPNPKAKGSKGRGKGTPKPGAHSWDSSVRTRGL